MSRFPFLLLEPIQNHSANCMLRTRTPTQNFSRRLALVCMSIRLHIYLVCIMMSEINDDDDELGDSALLTIYYFYFFRCRKLSQRTLNVAYRVVSHH